MQDTRVTHVITKIKAGIVRAKKDRNGVAVAALQAVLARISNAEAVKSHGQAAGIGVGSTEVQRRQLSYTDVLSLIQAELREIADALLVVDPNSQYATELRYKAAVLARIGRNK